VHNYDHKKDIMPRMKRTWTEARSRAKK